MCASIMRVNSRCCLVLESCPPSVLKMRTLVENPTTVFPDFVKLLLLEHQDDAISIFFDAQGLVLALLADVTLFLFP